MADDHRLPAQRQALPLIAGLALSSLLAVVAVRCSSRNERDLAAPNVAAAPQTHGDEAEARALRATTRGGAAVVEQEQQQEQAPRDAGAPTTIGRLMRATDEHDRSLLADIERKAKQAPPASAFKLLELRRAGRPRAELERFIHTELEGGAPVRLAAMQWLRAIYGEPEPKADIDIVREPGTPSPLPRTVKPLTKSTP